MAKRFIFQISSDIHTKLKMMAAKKGMTMGLYITKALIKQLQRDLKDD